MAKYNITVFRVVKPGIKYVDVANPYTKILNKGKGPNSLPGGDEGEHYDLWLLLNECFKDQGCAFEGLVLEFVELANQKGKTKVSTLKAFKELERIGFIKIEGDHFIPTQVYLDKCIT